jgi:hypothetical protein
MPAKFLADVAVASLEDQTRQRFDPMVMAEDLVAAVELMAAAIEAIPTDQLDQSGAEQLVASLDASFDVLRQVRRRLRRTAAGRRSS